MFAPIPDKPDHSSLEQGILDLWERDQTFNALRAKNADGPRFSFTDGPVTANKDLAVHTAWGRTLKDVFQRYKALNGFHQRYQNGFDCQGLWIEVGVERQLGLNSKREIEEYGLAAFAAQCRAVVEKSSAELTKGSIRLGQWMDWGNDYFTFSDTNIEYIWKFLSIVNERGWLFKGHRATEWCPRCGTSISAHELAGSYVDRDDPSLFVRFPLLDREGESLVIWTTTPWTLPANVAAAVKPDLPYGRKDNGDWVAVGVEPDTTFVETKLGAELVGWRYSGPFDDLEPGGKVAHRVIPWDEVSTEEGTGIVHIAPGCGAEDFELGKVHDLPMIMPVDENGLFYPEFGWLAGMTTGDAKEPVLDSLRERNRLVKATTKMHRFPECWRCHTPLIFRISDDWFISVSEIREPMREANRSVEWTPPYMGKRMDDWLVNMGDWNISRRRYYGLPLPFYPCSCGHITVVGSRAELADRATVSLDGLQELRRPWIDDITIACEECGKDVKRIEEVGDVWLDAGIVPFSTLGWENPEWIEHGYGNGAAKGLTGADLPDHEYWQQWFPADWVSEMREQIRLWFYSQLFMSVALTGKAPYRKVLGYEKMLDETGREMHGSWGNMISADDAFTRMGADVMRWQFCQQPPWQDLLFGFKPGQEIQRKLLTLWNSLAFFVQYANVAEFTPSYADLDAQDADETHSMDRWVQALTQRFVATATEGYEQYLTVNVLKAFDQFVDDLSNWYIRRSRRRFWSGDEAALRSLWVALVQGLRTVAPIMPFLTEQMWQQLVVDVCPDAPSSVFLAGWPTVHEYDAKLLDEVAAMRRVIELGRRARSASKMPLRQPLARLVIDGVSGIEGYIDEIAEELRVKVVTIDTIEATQIKVRPNLSVLGPRLGSQVTVVRKALEAGEFVQLADGSFEVAGMTLAPADVLVERIDKEGWAVASDEEVTVALDTELNDELRLEARVYDVIHKVNGMRKESGLEISDRIDLVLPTADGDLLDHRDWIAGEVLAVSINVAADSDELTLTKSG